MEIDEIKNYLIDIKQLKQELEHEFNFEIPEYIVDEIYTRADYYNFSALVNVAKVNGRITKENATILKNALKSRF